MSKCNFFFSRNNCATVYFVHKIRDNFYRIVKKIRGNDGKLRKVAVRRLSSYNVAF